MLRPVNEQVVEQRRLADYDDALGVDIGVDIGIGIGIGDRITDVDGGVA